MMHSGFANAAGSIGVRTMSIAVLIFGFGAISILSADARHYGRHAHRGMRHAQVSAVSAQPGCTYTNEGRYLCGASPVMLRTASAGVGSVRVARIAADATVIGSRPADCPRAYCGCGLRKYLGIADVRLNLAANWARFFPHESGPRAGLAAVRSHHVAYIEGSAGNGLWTVRDYNSGRGLSHIHVADLRGYTFVNPRAGIDSRSNIRGEAGQSARAEARAVF